MNNSTKDGDIIVLSLCGLGVSVLLGAIGILGYQIYTFLHFGYWVPISVVTALGWLDSKWALAPTEWLGLHKVLDFIPLSAASFGLAVIVAWVAWIMDMAGDW